jgi:hypothetical protein
VKGTLRRLAFWSPFLLASLLQFASAGGRLSGDGASYYAQLRSLAKDHDIDLANEYAALGIADRPDLRVPTRTGLRRTVFPVGPALLGLPFFALGEGAGRLAGLLLPAPDLSGYGEVHVQAVALGGFAYGFLCVWLVESTLRRHFRPGIARLSALLIWLATFLQWYMVRQPVMSHAPSAFMAALFLWLWDARRGRARVRDAAGLGLVGGLAMCVRWTNAVLLVLPLIDLMAGAVRARRRGAAVPVTAPAGRAAALAAGALAGALPQLLVWHALYGTWMLAAPPQGTDFVRLWRPFLLETLFSSRHGLLSWTPVLWAGFLGFIPLLRRRAALAGPLLAPLAVLTYVNACSGDWWAGGSFSNRRFDTLLPVLAFGVAAAVDVSRRQLRRRPLLLPATVVAAAALWNVPLAFARARGTLPSDDAVAFDRLVEGVAATTAGAVGSPPTWPASWLFAGQTGLPPSRYDTVAGRYLFYRQNNQRGCVEPGIVGFEPQLAGGWGARADTPAGPARTLSSAGRVYVGLDLPEDLTLSLRARAEAVMQVAVEVNGRPAGAFALPAGWTTARLRVPRALWRRDVNTIALTPEAPALVRGLRFERAAGEPPAACGVDAP